jgi:hypothetical protein
VLLGDGGGGGGLGRADRGDQQVDLVVGDQALVQAGRGGGIGAIVVDDEFDLLAQQAAARLPVCDSAMPTRTVSCACAKDGAATAVARARDASQGFMEVSLGNLRVQS